MMTPVRTLKPGDIVTMAGRDRVVRGRAKNSRGWVVLHLTSPHQSQVFPPYAELPTVTRQAQEDMRVFLTHHHITTTTALAVAVIRLFRGLEA